MSDERPPAVVGKELVATALRSCGAARDFLRCVEYLHCLLEQWDILPEVARSALYQSAVIVYTRPFGQQEGTVPYRLRLFRKRPDFDRGVHDHLVRLRNRFIAHIDQPAYRSQVGFQVYEVREVGQAPISIPQAVVGQTFSWSGVADKVWVARFLAHAQAAARIASEYRDIELKEVLAFAHAHPEAYTPTRAVRLEEFGPNANLPLDLAPLVSNGAKPPDEHIGGPDYLYEMNSQIVASEVIVERDGEILFSVRRGATPQAPASAPVLQGSPDAADVQGSA